MRKPGRPKKNKADRRVFIGVCVSPEAAQLAKNSTYRSVSEYVNQAILEKGAK